MNTTPMSRSCNATDDCFVDVYSSARYRSPTQMHVAAVFFAEMACLLLVFASGETYFWCVKAVSRVSSLYLTHSDSAVTAHLLTLNYDGNNLAPSKGCTCSRLVSTPRPLSRILFIFSTNRFRSFKNTAATATSFAIELLTTTLGALGIHQKRKYCRRRRCSPSCLLLWLSSTAITLRIRQASRIILSLNVRYRCTACA